MAKKDAVRVETLKRLLFARDFETKEEWGFTVKALCKYCCAAGFDNFLMAQLQGNIVLWEKIFHGASEAQVQKLMPQKWVVTVK